MERSYVSPGYQDVLNNLAESLRADRRRQFLAQMSVAEGPVAIPSPSVSPEQFAVVQ